MEIAQITKSAIEEQEMTLPSHCIQLLTLIFTIIVFYLCISHFD
jgi:hypothetical protein